jgi:protein-S-isoprenylcysteine O-methyltransferase Ste14
MTTTLTWAVFGVGLAAALANSVGIVASVFGESEYYPTGARDGTYYAFWGLTHVLNAALVGVAVLQWRVVEPSMPVTVAVLALFLVGFAVAVLAGLDLGVEETQGMPGELRTGGWYRFSRNPQYVGYVLATVTFPVWTGAPLTVPLCGVYLFWWFLFPLAEEPWLREQYGEAYERYAERVPRFVGRQTVRELLDRAGDLTSTSNP